MWKTCLTAENFENTVKTVLFRNVTKPANWMWISCAKSVGVGYGCRFVTWSKLVQTIIAAAIQLSYLKLNSYKQTSGE